MSHVFKSGQSTASQTYSALRVTTAQYGQPIHVPYGRTRVSSQLIYAGNFQVHNAPGKKQKGSTYYTVNADFCMGYGPMQGIGSLWIDRSYYNGYEGAPGTSDPFSFSQTFTLAGPATSFSFTISNNPTPVTNIIGVTVQQNYSVTYNDYGGPGSITLSGTTQLPVYNNLFPAPNNGTWANAAIPYATFNSTYANTSGTVVFPTSQSSVTFTVYYRCTAQVTGLPPLTYLGIQFERQLGSGTEGSPITYPEFSGFGMVNWNMQSANVLPNFDMEPYALFGYGQHQDVNPADIIIDLICSGSYDALGASATWNHGLGLSSYNSGTARSYSRFGGILADEPNLWGGASPGAGTNLGLNTVRNYCQANGLAISDVLDAQDTPARYLEDLCDIANCAPVWDGVELDFIPYSEVSFYGNGASYVAPTASGPIFTLTAKNFLVGDNEPPVTVQRARAQDNYNSLPIEFTDRSNMYNVNSVTVSDAMDITTQGPMPGASKSYHWIKDSGTATQVGQVLLKRNLMVKRRTYKFKLPASWGLLRLMDLILLNEPSLGAAPVPVRLTKITENPDFSLECEAEPFIYGASAPVIPAAVGSTTPPNNQPVDSSVDPGSVNAPIIFEAIPAISSSPQIWFALSGSAQYYGGCHVWLSTDGGSTYNMVGTAGGSNTMGLVYSANYPSHADPDGTDTLNVDLTESLGSLTSFTNAQRDLFQSLCLLTPGGTVTLSTGQTLTIPYELIAYATANLSSANKYALPPTIRRGVFGTSIAAHNIGQSFSYLNDGFIFKLNMPQSWVGQTLYFKFTAFNIYGLQEQQLSSVTAYPFTPTGLVGWSWTPNGTAGSGGSGTGPTTTPTPTGSNQLPEVIGFVIASGTAGTNVGPMLAASRAGAVTKCVVTVKASDPSTNLTFRIKQNGADVFSTDPTVTHGTASGTVLTFTALTSSPLLIAQNDVFSIDITGGSSAWQFSTQLEP